MSNLPGGWRETTLGAISAKPQYGWTTKARSAGPGPRLLRTTDITSGEIDWTQVPYCTHEPDDVEKFLLRTDDIVVSRAGSVGASIRLNAPPQAVFASYLIRLRVLGDVDPAYVAWFLKSPDYWRQVREAAAGIALLNVNAKKLAAIRIPLAPPSMQRRIVAAMEERLSRLDAAEVLLLRSKRRLESLRISVITSVLDNDWPRFQWKEIGRSQNGRAFPSRDYSNKGVCLLRPGNLAASGHVIWTEQNTRRMPAHYREQFPSYVVGPNELVMNLTAQSLKDEFLGRVCLTGPQEQCLLNQRLARLSPLDADVHYLLFVFKARPFRRFVDSLNKGSLIQHMFTSQLAEFEVPLPPRDEQRRIVADIERRLSIVDATMVAVEEALARCSSLRRAVLQQAFTGRLVPHDPSGDAGSALVDGITSTRTSASSSSRRRGRTLA